jgi:hypothetical protein
MVFFGEFMAQCLARSGCSSTGGALPDRGVAQSDHVPHILMAASPALESERLCLRPFDPATAPKRLRLEANLRRQGTSLTVRWILSGDLQQLRLPEPVEEPQRLDELWTSTCLECFLARPADEGYWELNVSPAGHWNLYRLDGYRQGLRPEPSLQHLPSRLQLSAIGEGEGIGDSTDQPLEMASALAQEMALELALELASAVPTERALELSVELDLGALLGAEASSGDLELGVTAVLAHQDGQLSYWALHHPAAEADFHHRGGFGVRLPA